MSTVQTWQIESTSLEDTLRIAEQIGSRLHGGEVIELISDVGGGKTAFTRGLAKGMGSTDAVRSPSFTISNEYRSGKLHMYHFDFYRLTEPGIMRDEIAEVVGQPEAVVVVEWAEIVDSVLPADHITITITASSDEGRMLKAKYPLINTYLFN